MVSYEIRTMNALPPAPTPDCGPSTELPDEVVGHRNPCSPEQELEIGCLNHGTCYTTPFSSIPSCECPDNYGGLRCESRQLPPDIWQNKFGGPLRTEEYVAIAVVIVAFIIIIAITSILVLRYRRQRPRLRYHVNNNNHADLETAATESEKEKENLKPAVIEIDRLPPKSTRDSLQADDMPRVHSRGRLTAVASLSSDEEDFSLLSPTDSQQTPERVTGV